MFEYVLTAFFLAVNPTTCTFPPLTHSQLWRVESTGEERNVTYLSTLLKHTQAVNVVRFCPKGNSSHPSYQ